MQADEELLRRLARSSGLSKSDVRRALRIEVVMPADGAPNAALARRLRRVRRLRRDLGLSMDAVEIIVRLLDRIDVLEGRSPPRRRARVGRR